MNQPDPMKMTPDQRDKLESWQQAETQIETLKDIAKKTQTVINEINRTQLKDEKNSGNLGSLLMDIRESIDELVSKEAPDSPDYAKPVVEAVRKLEKALSTSIKSIDIKPEVKVDSPQVTNTVDLKGVEKVLKTDIPKAFEKAVKSIPQTELPETDFSPLVDKLDELASKLADIDTGVRLKPEPGIIQVVNPDGTPVGTPIIDSGDDRFVDGLITIQNSSPTTDNGTGGSTVTITVEDGYDILGIQTVGTYTGALTVQGTINGINWVSFAGSQILNLNTAGYLATITSALQSTFQVKVAGLKQVRVSALAAVTGSVRVSLRLSKGASPIASIGTVSTVTTVTTVSTLTSITNWGNIVDNAGFTDGTTRLSMSGYIYDEVAGTALTENDAAAARIDSKRAQVHTLEDGSTRGRYATVTSGNALKVDPSGLTMPTTLISFVTTNVTSGVRTQLASNTITNGFILQAPSTNTGIIYVGGATVSSTVYGAELQAGQSTSVAVNNTNLIYIDSSVSGDKCAVIGS